MYYVISIQSWGTTPTLPHLHLLPKVLSDFHSNVWGTTLLLMENQVIVLHYISIALQKGGLQLVSDVMHTICILVIFHLDHHYKDLLRFKQGQGKPAVCVSDTIILEHMSF